MPDLQTQIGEARANGYSDADILGYLAKSRRDLAPKIAEAQHAGYAAADIVGHLGGSAPASVAPPAGIPDAGAQMRSSALGQASALMGDNSAPVPVHPYGGAPVIETPVGDSFLQAPQRGAVEMVDGAAQTTRGTARDAAGGASKIIRGGMRVLSPTMGAAVIAAPVATAAGLAAGTVAQQGVTSGLQAAGVPQEYSDLAGDVAGIAAGHVGAKYGPGVIAKVPEAVANARVSAADVLKTSAEKNIDTALHPTTKVNKAITADTVAPGLAERGVVATSIKDLQAQAEAKADFHGEHIDDIFDAEAAKGTKLSPQPILESLEREKQEYIVDGEAINPAYVDRLSAMQKQIERVSAANGGDIPLASLRKIRDIQDEIIEKSKGQFALPPDAQSEVSAAKTYRGAIRSSFADNVDGLADENREYSFWANVDKVASDSLLRKVGQRSPLTTKVMQGIGALIGHHIAGTEGAIAGAYVGGKVAQLKGGALWNTLSANAKMRVADLLDAGDEQGAAAVAQNPANQTRAAAPAPAAAANAPAPAAAPPAATPPPGSDATVVKVPGEPHNSYPAVYRVRELDDVQPSHNGLTFSENPKYGLDNQRDYETGVNQGKVVNGSLPSQFDPTFHITDNPDPVNGPVIVDENGNALGGNGRAMILQRIYAAGGKAAAAYRDTLTKKAAQFGIDPADVAQMKRPVLVREVPDSAFTGARSKADAIADFNKTGTAALTPAERAIADSQRVSPATLADVGARLESEGDDATLSDVLANTKHGGAIVDQLVKDGVVTPQERAGLQDSSGKLTKAGRERVSQLMLGRFFRDPEQLETVAPGVRQKIERMAAPLAQAETAAPEWDLTPHLRDAVDLLERARAAGTKNLDDFVKQEDLLGADKYPAETLTLARALQGKSAKELTAGARQYAADANEGAKGDGLFGAAPEPGKSLADAFGGKPAAKPQSGAETQAAEALAQAKSGKTAPAESLYPSLFAKLKAGDTMDAGKTSLLLTLAKPLFDSGEISTPAELRAFAQKVYGKPAKAKAAAPPIPPPAARSGSGSPAALGDIGKK